MNALEKASAAQSVAVTTDAGSILEVITRAAADPNINVEKIERLVALYRQMKADEAKRAFLAALSAMQPDLPVIERRGRITIKDKATPAQIIQATPYALWDDINEAIKPLLKQHGFTLSFRTGIAADGKITVTGILGHAGGHQEETTVTLPHDSTGSKNAVQAVGSSTSYGKRYAAGALLNLTFKDEDDDGASGGTKTLDDEQIGELRHLIVDAGADLPKFLGFMKVERLEQIPSAQFDKAKHALQQKARKVAS